MRALNIRGAARQFLKGDFVNAAGDFFFLLGKGMWGGVLLPQLPRCGGVEVACARIKITSKCVVLI